MLVPMTLYVMLLVQYVMTKLMGDGEVVSPLMSFYLGANTNDVLGKYDAAQPLLAVDIPIVGYI